MSRWFWKVTKPWSISREVLGDWDGVLMGWILSASAIRNILSLTTVEEWGSLFQWNGQISVHLCLYYSMSLVLWICIALSQDRSHSKVKRWRSLSAHSVSNDMTTANWCFEHSLEAAIMLGLQAQLSLILFQRKMLTSDCFWSAKSLICCSLTQLFLCFFKRKKG